MIKTLLSAIPPLALFLLPLPTHADSVTVGLVEGNRQLSYDSSQSIRPLAKVGQKDSVWGR